MMRPTTWVGLCSLFAGALLTAPAAGADANTIVRPTMQVKVKAGEEIQVRAHWNWTRQCQSQDPPEIKVTRPPQSGAVDVRKGDYAVTGSLSGNSVCVGKTLPGIAIFYKAGSQPGTDSFHYTELVGGTRKNSITRLQEWEVEVTVE
ncbi:MAG TPA: hypothetical protein VMU15_14430 [Anaeromyxobacter sp.]|nr:hypothetical protein [Anaeromyxobacter sp.]